MTSKTKYKFFRDVKNKTSKELGIKKKETEKEKKERKKREQEYLDSLK